MKDFCNLLYICKTIWYIVAQRLIDASFETLKHYFNRFLYNLDVIDVLLHYLNVIAEFERY